MSDTIDVEVIYALPDRQELIQLKLPVGSTLGDAVQASGLPQKYPDIDLQKGKFGIFSKLTRPDAALRARDRVEIYRPLIADPKAVRAARAAEGKAMKKHEAD
ncbi:MAG: RnfH family protein [Zoogloeaceae bacterium]|jgi:putative ubiquitin-RnfH superfamily antitoxin RatB of RatAB toxin-antitoxin module|nr:RnfH family protein [Zoogloeaceae bacterium]